MFKEKSEVSYAVIVGTSEIEVPREFFEKCGYFQGLVSFGTGGAAPSSDWEIRVECPMVTTPVEFKIFAEVVPSLLTPDEIVRKCKDSRVKLIQLFDLADGLSVPEVSELFLPQPDAVIGSLFYELPDAPEDGKMDVACHPLFQKRCYDICSKFYTNYVGSSDDVDDDIKALAEYIVVYGLRDDRLRWYEFIRERLLEILKDSDSFEEYDRLVELNTPPGIKDAIKDPAFKRDVTFLRAVYDHDRPGYYSKSYGKLVPVLLNSVTGEAHCISSSEKPATKFVSYEGNVRKYLDVLDHDEFRVYSIPDEVIQNLDFVYSYSTISGVTKVTKFDSVAFCENLILFDEYLVEAVEK